MCRTAVPCRPIAMLHEPNFLGILGIREVSTLEMDAKPTYVQEERREGWRSFTYRVIRMLCAYHIYIRCMYATQEEKNQQRMWISVPPTFFFLLSCLLACYYRYYFLSRNHIQAVSSFSPRGLLNTAIQPRSLFTSSSIP
jgi:hypothetical protein